MTVRIIPRLDIKGPNLVKGIHMEGLRVLGKPEQVAKYYYQHGADELIYMDIVASLLGRNNLLHIVERTSREIFIPLTVGGGLRSIDDIKAVLLAGADKVSINTAAIRRPKFIMEAAKKFGSSTIVVSIEAIKREDGCYEAYIDNGREETGFDVFGWAERVEKLGAGEILLTSINREGTGKGFDVDLVKKVSESVSIPVIAGGGAGKINHISQVISQGKADAISIASILHYNYLRGYTLNEKDFKEEGNIDFLKKNNGFLKINDESLPSIKKHIISKGINCRPFKGRGEK